MQMLLADFVLIVHFAFATFIIGGLGLIWLGAAVGWQWVRNLQFRIIHLAAICLVAGESLLGVVCPLTAWEDWLRGGAQPGTSFVARWIHRILYYSFPEWVFTVSYLLVVAAVAVTFWRVPPRSRRR